MQPVKTSFHFIHLTFVHEIGGAAGPGYDAVE